VMDNLPSRERRWCWFLSMMFEWRNTHLIWSDILSSDDQQIDKSALFAPN
jgi:hypothetical protein